MDANTRNRPRGFLDLPMEVRLEIYRELLMPQCLACKDWTLSEKHSHESGIFHFPTAVLLINKKINEEAKVIFYGNNIFCTAIDTEDVRQGNNGIDDDRERRLDMLRFVKKAHVHIEMAGELVWEWNHPGSSSRQGYIDYVRDGFSTFCQQFAEAPALKSVTISFRDKMHLQSWLPDDDSEALSIDRADLWKLPAECFRYIVAGGLKVLPPRIEIIHGSINVLNLTDPRFEDAVEELESKVKIALRSIGP